MRYRPTFRSFLSSVALSLSPAASAGVVLYVQWPDVGWILLFFSGLMGLFSVMLLLQDILVHLSPISVDELGISSRGSYVPWSSVRQATLRERRNALSRTDHLLILEAAGRAIAYPTSVLSKAHEAHLLDAVRRRVPLITNVDPPTV